jgi:hypothetical protein
MKEAAMSTAKSVCAAVAITGLLGLFGTSSALAEKWDCSGVKKFKQLISREVVRPGDRPDRELVQIVRVSVWDDGAEETEYEHEDQVAGAGTHSGFSVVNRKEGEKLWTKWEGAHYRVPKGDAWEIRYQGVFRFIAGTGKYKAIRGQGYYHGTGTPAGSTTEVICEAEY